jgi:hypothetical protein
MAADDLSEARGVCAGQPAAGPVTAFDLVVDLVQPSPAAVRSAGCSPAWSRQLVTSFPSGNLSSYIDSKPSELNNGTAENLSLLQRNAGLVSLFQGVSLGH